MAVKNNIYEKIIANLHDGLFFVDKDAVITYWNKAAERITGYPRNEVLGKSCTENFLSYYDEEGNMVSGDLCPIQTTISDGIPRESDLYIIHKNGSRIPVSVRVSTVKDSKNRITGAIELFTDISTKTVNELRIRELEKIALVDNLTKLANRHYIEKELKSRFEEKKRFNIPFGILFADIDDFKEFNDRYGHLAGDEVLKKVAEVFVTNSRPFDLFGRWGGEEFIGIIRNINGSDLYNLGEKMRNLVSESKVVKNDEMLRITISIGATLVKQGDSINSLIERADRLLYKSKDSGKNILSSDF